MAIYKENNKNKWTKDGRKYYYAVYYTDIYGKRKKKISKMYFRLSEAKQAEYDFITEIKNHNIQNKIDFETAYNEWFNFKKATLKSSTYYHHRKTLDKHVLTYFKSFKDINKITVDILNKWVNYMLKKPFGIEYINKCIGNLQSILDYFVKNYDFNIKVASKLHKIKVEEIKQCKKSKNNYWTYKDFNKFINTVDDKLYFILFNFMYYTGVRFGEMNALNWNDIDFEKKTLTINKTLTTKIIEGGFKITTPKTNNSNRIIDLDDNLIKLLKEHYASEKKIYGFSNKMFVFGNIRFIPETTFIRKLNYYITKANVKRITPHGFRHSHASLLIDLGCDSYEVAERLGDTVRMIENTYYHIFPQKKKNTINVLNNLNNSR